MTAAGGIIRLHVGIFTNTYLPTVSGVVNSIEAFRRGLQALGHSVYVFAPRVPGQPDEEQQVFRYPSVPAPARVEYPLALPFSRTVRSALRRIPLDIVHTQHPWWVGAWGARHARRARVPLVTTVHTQYERYLHYVKLPRALVRPLVNWQTVRYCNACDVVATPGGSMAEWLGAQGVQSPVEVLPNATDLSPFAAADDAEVRGRYGVAEDETLLMFGGRIAPEKSLDFMLRAFAIVRQRCPQARLLLAGDGPALSSLQALAADLGVAGQTIFAGPVPYSEMPKYHGAADLFVMTSLSEVQPLVLSEAMAAGAVLVAVRAPGPQDMVQGGVTGRLPALVAGVEGFAEAVCRVIEDTELRERLAANARVESQRYDIPNATQRLLAVYELARQRHAASRKDRKLD